MKTKAQGFTLLEVMVALSILALGIVTILELFAGSLRLGTKASQRTQAVIYAQTVMDQFFAQPTLEDGEESGELPGGYVWRARVQEIYPDDEENSRFPSDREAVTDFFHLKEIEVSVSWEAGQGQSVFVLRSLRTTTREEQEEQEE